eukprot:TRINITY_DN9000_c0_g2_i1.p1 TRINITY_DN9000_c0_g2~~TRINITY_DN9000_c0_g2_i1.p1  ORF type:complete len:546 (+),score=104.11 TRINITY_DN9000_c0_g2_i1:72-1640(+)
MPEFGTPGGLRASGAPAVTSPLTGSRRGAHGPQGLPSCCAATVASLELSQRHLVEQLAAADAQLGALDCRLSAARSEAAAHARRAAVLSRRRTRQRRPRARRRWRRRCSPAELLCRVVCRCPSGRRLAAAAAADAAAGPRSVCSTARAALALGRELAAAAGFCERCAGGPAPPAGHASEMLQWRERCARAELRAAEDRARGAAAAAWGRLRGRSLPPQPAAGAGAREVEWEFGDHRGTLLLAGAVAEQLSSLRRLLSACALAAARGTDPHGRELLVRAARVRRLVFCYPPASSSTAVAPTPRGPPPPAECHEEAAPLPPRRQPRVSAAPPEAGDVPAGPRQRPPPPPPPRAGSECWADAREEALRLLAASRRRPPLLERFSNHRRARSVSEAPQNAVWRQRSPSPSPAPFASQRSASPSPSGLRGPIPALHPHVQYGEAEYDPRELRWRDGLRTFVNFSPGRQRSPPRENSEGGSPPRAAHSLRPPHSRSPSPPGACSRGALPPANGGLPPRPAARRRSSAG